MVGEIFILQEFLQLQEDLHLCSAPDAPGGGFRVPLHPVHPAEFGCAHGRSSAKPACFPDWQLLQFDNIRIFEGLICIETQIYSI